MNRRGFLRLVGAATALPVLADASGLVASASELVLPSGSLVVAADSSAVHDTIRATPLGGDWDWPERYKQKVAYEIEAEAYDRITFVAEVEGFARYSLPCLAHEVGATYTLAGPLIGRRYSAMVLDEHVIQSEPFLPHQMTLGPELQAAALGTIRHGGGLARSIARKVAASVERDVFEQLVRLHGERRGSLHGSA